MKKLHTSNGPVAPQATAEQSLTHQPSLLQVQRLAAWLSEWKMEMKLRNADMPPLEDSSPATEEEKSELSRSTSAFDPQPRCGEIRLLSRGLLPDCRRPLHIAIVSDWSESVKLVAPYGSFSEPASTGELLTGRTESDLRVLCLWNSHTIPDDLVAQSWVVGTMSKTELEEARAVFEHVTFGHPLPSHLGERVGPPILNPEDARAAYQKEEMEMMRPLVGMTLELAEK